MDSLVIWEQCILDSPNERDAGCSIRLCVHRREFDVVSLYRYALVLGDAMEETVFMLYDP